MQSYTKFLIPCIEIDRIYPKKVMIKKDFGELNQMLPTTNKKYSIEDFMTIYSKNYLMNNKVELKDNFMNINYINGYKLCIHLFDCIKRRKDF